MDPVALLLIALKRAGVIPSEDVVPLHVSYLQENLNIRLGIPGEREQPFQ
ncbi:hypothetical protein H4V98_004396 [Polaromonas sp. CG_23.6]|nr:hypothetical protein [Polaromonas sp. CG_23.6]